MSRFRYDTTKSWFKGNTHIHSTHSDGGKTVEELGIMYAGAGYDFLFRTDHWAPSAELTKADGVPLLWLPGFELDGRDAQETLYHVVCLGKVDGLSREMGLPGGMAHAREQGALLILAHPHWCGNGEPEAMRYAFDGVEAYNHVCQWINGKGLGLTAWDAMLTANTNTLGFAADDAHINQWHPGWNGGWIWVNAASCTAEELLPAIRAGNFYASCGPEIYSIEQHDDTVTVRTSPVRFLRLVGPAWNGQQAGSFTGPLLTEATFTLSSDWRYHRLEIEDENGRRAWTNALLVE